MADIELVIKIPEEVRRALINNIELSQGQQSICCAYMKYAIIGGTLLPKNHGRLIDADELLTVTDYMEDGTERCYVPYVHIKEAETIIEADRSEEECQEKKH